MRTIKTYFKGAPFYIASVYRNMAFGRVGPISTFRQPLFNETWKATFHRRLEFFPERKGHSPANAEKGKRVVPFEPLAQIKECKDHKYNECDDFLDYLQLKCREFAVADAVGGH